MKCNHVAFWGAKQKLNPIANNPSLYTLHLTLYTKSLSSHTARRLLGKSRLLGI